MIGRRSVLLAASLAALPGAAQCGLLRGARHGALLAGDLPFPAAALFAGMPFGMGAAELRAWAVSGEGRRLWDDGWARAGFCAFPCAMLETRFLQVPPRPGLVAAAWMRLHDESGMRREAMQGGGCAFALPFAYGQVIEFALPLDVWAALPGVARRAIEGACRAGFAETARLARVAEPMPALLAAGFADALAQTLREDAAMEGARHAYAAARRGATGGPGPVA